MSSGYNPGAYPPIQTHQTHDSQATIQGYNDKMVSFDNHRSNINRTPSPTPSEAADLARKGVIDFRALFSWKTWAKKAWIKYYIILFIILVVIALTTIYHTQIVHFLKPATDKLVNITAGWLIPVAVLFVISFPPLFGHEIVAVVVGLAWGLWIGFGIVALGTLLGEIGNFYAFRYCCTARGKKFENSSLFYAELSQVCREGGFLIALAARLSIVPGHLTTAVFATCGMNIFIFTAAAILSMPKQFLTVYIGAVLESSADSNGTQSKSPVSYIVVAVTFVITLVCLWYILHEMNKVKEQVIYARRKARQSKEIVGLHPYESSSSGAFNANGSGTDIPLTSTDMPYGHQQWDKNGHAVGYSGEPMHAPIAQRRASPQFHSEHDYGHVYPAGRSPIRQDSDENVSWDQPPAPKQSYELAPPGLQSNAAYSNDQQPPHLPSSYEFGHRQEETSDTFHTAHSRFTTENESHPPQTYQNVPY